MTTDLKCSARSVSMLLAFCVAAAGLLLAAAGCTVKEAPSAGFVDKSKMETDPTLPFQRVWIKPGFDKSRYTKLYVAPVNTSYMLQMTKWQEGIKKDDIEKDVAKLAVFTQDTIKKAFREDPKQRMEILESSPNSPDALVIEMALIEVVPSKVVLNALGYAPFGIGLAITAVRGLADDVSSVAIEARLRDAATREIVAMIADREIEQRAIVSVRGLTWYSHAQAIITNWANQFVEIANRKPDETVKGAGRFTLKPW
jgi:hypothetical protein